MRLTCYHRWSATILVLGVLALFCRPALAAQDFRYADSWTKPGLSLDAAASSHVELSFSLEEWSLGDLELDGRTQSTVIVPGLLLQNEAGAPNLPGAARYLAVPNGAAASVRVIASRVETLRDVEIAPAPRIPFENEDGLVYDRDASLYATNAFYPDEVVKLSPLGRVRGVEAVIVGISPFQYNPVTRELRIYRDLRVTVDFTGGDGTYGETRLRSRWWDPMMHDLFLNSEVLPEVTYDLAPQSRDVDFEYVIICQDSPEFLAWADSLRLFRTEQGIRTGVFTTTQVGGNTTTAIEGFINNAYNNWTIPPAAVLLLGDYGTGATGIISPVWNSYCVSDNIYADVDGDDLPDVILARITARHAQDLQTMVGKGLGYERNPPTSPSFYQNPIVAGGWQDERWFILCSEVVYGYLANELGKTPVREYAIYSGSPGTIWSENPNTGLVVSYFGPSGLGYIPATPQHLTDWGGNATRINADINAGSFILQHRDHGDVDGWGEPSYTTPNIAGLNNDDLTFVFSINCLTGAYNNASECFTEAFHRHAKGALGLTAASEISYSFVNDVYIFGMYDYFWPDFDPGYGAAGPHDLKPAFGNAAGKYYLQVSNWPYNPEHKVYTDHLFHHHGDAFMTVYSEVPQPLLVSHDDALLSGVTFFNVSADEGAMIGLSVDGQLIGTAIGTGAPQAVTVTPQLPGADLVVTVTQQNHLRYRSTVPIIPPSGPYVVYNSCVIDDAVGGNANGALDYGESVLLDVTLHNVGLVASENAVATLATSDPLVTLLDATADFGTIAADGLATVAGAFGLTVDVAVPDGHPINFTLVVTDDESTYTSYFQLVAHAPVVVVDNFMIDDQDDNVLDPGETADLAITFRNDGTAVVADLTVQITSLNPNVVMTDDTWALSPLVPAGEEVTAFTLEASESATVGELAEFQVDVTGPDYEFHTTVALTIGLTFEDFETGNLLHFPWQMSGEGPWVIDTTEPQEGIYCGRSGVITHNQSSAMSLELEVLSPGQISFWYKVSSESGYDYLRFKVDGADQGSWSGTVGWTQATYPVTAGVHTFTWAYTKDVSVNTGSDCGWVDMIVFPAVGAPPMPVMTSSPTSVSVALDPGQTTTRDIEIQNKGEGELNYTVTLTDEQRRQAAQAPAINLKKDAVDTREGSAPADGQGGPDQFGYRWIDSDEAGGPTYEWIEIRTLGTVPGSGDDANYGPFNLGFTFSYYGVPYTQVRICTNGWISFTSTSTSYTNGAIPNAAEPNNMLAALWDDLNPSVSSPGAIYYLSDPANGRFIVEWDAIRHYGTTNAETFQVILNDDGTILYQYKTVIAGTTCSVGIENAAGTDGLQVVFNAAYLHSDLAVLFAAEEPWVAVSPMSGTIAPFSTATLEVQFSAVDVPIGDYAGLITIYGNDPDNPSDMIPVSLRVANISDVAGEGLPTRFALGRAHPNPFNPATKIGFALPRDCRVQLRIYDVAGRLVRTLVDRELTAGDHLVTWRGDDNSGRRVASGIYNCRLDAGDFEQTQKILLAK